MKQLIFCLAFLVPLLAHGYQLSGTITDTTGAPLAYSSVQLENSTIGVISDHNGRYFIELKNGDYVLSIKAFGYRERKVGVTIAGTDKQLDVILQVEEMAPLIVKERDRDPAYEIIDSVIANKKKFLRQYEGYTCNTYTKCGVERESIEEDSITGAEAFTKQHHNFIESFSTTHFTRPNLFKQVVHAYNDHTHRDNVMSVTFGIEWEDEGPPVGGDYNPYLFRQYTSDPGFNFYKNLISHPSLGSTPFISPFSSTALLSYRYRLIETYAEEDGLVYKIEVTPKRRASATFTGHVYIKNGSWAVKGVDLNINPSSLYLFTNFHINHRYEELDGGIWVLSREEYLYGTKEGREQVFGNTYMEHTDYKINPEFPKRFFGNEIRRVLDSAYDHDTAFWNQQRPITLRPAEQSFINIQDSIIAYHSSEAYMNEQDSIYNRVRAIDFLLMGVGFRNWTKKREIYFGPLISQPRPFGVGGYRHALPVSFQKEWKKGYAIDLDMEADYGFKNRDLKGGVDARFTYLPKRFGKIHVRVGDVYEMLNTYESIAAVFSRSNYINRRGFTLGHSMEFFNGFYADIDFEYALNRPITDLQLSSWSDSLFGTFNTPRDFNPFTEFYIDVNLTYTIRQKYYNEPYKKVILPSKYPQLKLWYKKGVPGLMNSVVDFDFLELSVTDEMTFGTWGESKYSVKLGRYFNQGYIQLTNYRFFRGSDRFFFSNPLLSFQLLDSTLATTNAYLQANYIHHFNGALMNKIPLLNRLGLQAVAGAGILYLEDNNFTHAEFFAGIEKPFKIRGDLFKIGVYFVGSDTNYSPADYTFKIGIDFFNAFTNKWSY